MTDPAPKTPYKERRFARGIELSPAAPLLAYLDALPSKRLVRLPIVLAHGDTGYQLRGARVGRAADAPTIRLDDSALGVGIGSRTRRHGDTLWLEGIWQRDDEGPVLRVMHVHDGDPPTHDQVEVADG